MEIFRYELARSWRGTLGWMVAIAAAATLYLSLYGSIADMMTGSDSMLNSLPPALTKSIGFDAISSGAGYAQSTLFGLLGFVLLVIASVVWGTSAVAGAEESGHLELTLAHAVSRTGYFLQMLLALLVRTGLIAATVGVMTFILNEPGSLNLNTSNILPMCVSYWLLGVACGSAALGVGAATGAKRLATGAGATIAVLAYMLNALGKQNPDWEWMLTTSPYHWTFGESPLMNGWDGQGVLWLSLLSLFFILLGWAVFTRRDVAQQTYGQLPTA